MVEHTIISDAGTRSRATVTVTHEGRGRYHYTVTTPEWRYAGEFRDIGDESELARSLCAFAAFVRRVTRQRPSDGSAVLSIEDGDVNR